MHRSRFCRYLASLIFGAATIGMLSTFAGASDFDRAALYRSNCAACHGVTGMGGGPVASTIIVPMPQLATLSQRYGGEFPADYVVQVIDGRRTLPAHGSRIMPVWGSFFDSGHTGEGAETSTRFLIDAIVEHIKTLQIE